MTGLWFQRAPIIVGFLIAVAALSASVWHYGFRQSLDQLALKGEANLALASDRLTGQLQRYQGIAVLLADHPELLALANGQDGRAARALLLSAADKTAALDILFVAPSGRVLVSAQETARGNMSGLAVFKRAMHGALGTDHGVNLLSEQRTYLFGAPTFSQSGRVIGALIVAVDIDRLEDDWAGDTPAVFFTDARREVFISNRSELLFWTRPEGQVGLVPSRGRVLPFEATQVGRYEIWQLGWGPYLPKQALHLTRPLPVIGMTGEVLIDVAPAKQVATLQSAAVASMMLAFGALLFLATERRRTLALANAVLESRVAQRTADLSQTNTQLRLEVTERQQAEDALRQAQADLVQAGKLSALGQMSAGISHELNQPLMAIQTFAENGSQYLDRGDVAVAKANMGRISDMAARMARIIKNLRAFARQETRELTGVDIVAVIDTALDLSGAHLRGNEIEVKWTPPTTPVWVHGGEVRLAQVMVNLFSNAADAMAGRSTRVLTISLIVDDRVIVQVADTGPGIVAPEKIFDPFYTTKEVGPDDGMGLGLSISYGLVQSFGGKIRGVNSPDGGAVFFVELERWKGQETT
jgi:two-component system C4-dicarboxylate transport sensor histidine kinase DctB